MADLWGFGALPYRVRIREAREPGEAGMRESENLEQRAHVARSVAGEAFQGGVDVRALNRRCARLQRRRADFDAERSQEVALRRRPERPRAARARRLVELVESDVSGEIGLARLGERVGEGVAPHGLQGAAERGALVAVVDDERRAALPDD